MRIALFVPGGVDRSGTDRVIPALLALIERLARRHAVLVLALTSAPAIGRYELLGATVHDAGGAPSRCYRTSIAAGHSTSSTRSGPKARAQSRRSPAGGSTCPSSCTSR